MPRLLMLFALVACGGPTTTEAKFCAHVASSSGCGGEDRSCPNHDGAARVEFPKCIKELDALETCLLDAKLACKSGSDFELIASGSGGTTMAIGYIGVYLVRLNTDECKAQLKAWTDCGLCGSAIGYGGTLGGVGDPCTSDAQCASGTTCLKGGCLKSCSDAFDCQPRFVEGPDACNTKNGRRMVCEAGQCATYCHGPGTSIFACSP